MKRKFVFIFVYLLIFFNTYDALLARDFGIGFVNSNIKKKLKVRKKPNTKSKTKFKLRENEFVTIIYSSGQKWYKIKHTKGKGWVKHKYLTVTEIFSESDDKIKRENKKLPQLNKSASKNKVSK